MDFSFYNFGFLLVFFIGSSISGDPPENELEIAESTESIQNERPEHQTSSEIIKGNSTRKRSRVYKTQNRKAVLCVGVGYTGKMQIPDSFKTLRPPKINPDNLSQEDMERKFRSLGDFHRWKELVKYTIVEYKAYWAHVCLYFWKKPHPNETRKQACHMSALLIPETITAVVYDNNEWDITQADLLGCRCYYYVNNLKSPVFNKSDFAIHKCSDNEYFILKRKNGTRYDFSVSNFLTEVTLPAPLN